MDRHFDQLGAHFARKIYDSPKGAVRLAVLTRDLGEWLRTIQDGRSVLRVLDAGAGLGHMSEWLALKGHQLTVTDPSLEMLEHARARLAQHALAHPPSFIQASLQTLPASGEVFDLVICHAVLEWLADPAEALRCLRSLVNDGGAISLAFYNRDALIYKNLIKGQFRKIERNQLAGEGRRSLTPQQPLDPRYVANWVADAGLELKGETGIRVFHDYMHEPFKAQASLDEVIERELLYSTHPAYRHMGRYLHWWLVPRTN
ncbi:S-adenosylmethionine-dependent methyltransferase [Halopseudomonas xinjiangensis]|uniref:tRNA 5-carboxymethoxyuridine methyltransferase n=1 Tax=Halopseudomonas xinjiangensis TaxID=487184 RepID=A0A1H1M9U4_9GAMM|nr:methyltransferase domain-containing protein [Halopseudomonas xinjiangensis]SDR83430.1 S-adenosylmethionine-dependent methyltransferase [Halopseudomonas xinjiangensis]